MADIRFEDALKHTIDLKGKNILASPDMLEAYMLDFAPGCEDLTAKLKDMSAKGLFADLVASSPAGLQTQTDSVLDIIRKDYPAAADRMEKALYSAFSLKKIASPKVSGSDQPKPVRRTEPSTADTNRQNPPVIAPNPDEPRIPPYAHGSERSTKSSNNGLLYMIIGALAAALVMFALMGRGGGRSTAAMPEQPVSASESQPAAVETEEVTETAVEKTPEPEETKEPVSEFPKTGTVYMSKNCEYQTIKVRSTPKALSDGSNDTKKRKRNGDRVTVYEIKQGSKYTWYRIGEDKWIAGNGTTYYVVFDSN